MSHKKLHNKIIKHDLNITDVITQIDADIDTIIQDSTKYFETVNFEVNFKDCNISVKGELNWIYNEISEVVDFVRLHIHETAITFESGSGFKLTLSEIKLIEESVKIG